VAAHPIELVLAALERAGVRYLVVGGVAVVLHGHLRTTADLDLVISLEPGNTRRTVEALAQLGFRSRAPVPLEQFADAAAREVWVAEKDLTVFSLWSPAHAGLEVDLFVREPFDFEAAWRRRATVALDTTAASVAAIEDVMALKRAAGRPQDLADVAALEVILRAKGGA